VRLSPDQFRVREAKRRHFCGDRPLRQYPVLSDAEIKILQLLHKSDYETYKETIAPRAEGTCTWFLEHPTYLAWLSEAKSSLLWVSGDPGCGKTVLSSFLIDTLKEAGSQSVPPATVCFFFCDDKIEFQNDGSAILSGILHQLFRMNRNLIQHAREHFEAKDSQIAMGIKSLCEIFKAASEDSAAGNIICVIDALDECEASSRCQVIEWFTSYITEGRKSGLPFLKVLMTSRSYQSIEDVFKIVPHIRLKAEDHADSTNEDVVRLIKLRSKRVQTITSCSDDTRDKIERRLIGQADRTFLWASLILDILEKSPEASEEAFDTILSSLPKRLDEVYEAILQKTSEPEQVKKTLAVLVASRRPLTLKELNMALSIRATDKSGNDIKPRLQFNMSRKVKGLCGPFVRVTNGRVYLVHQTAKEFLIKPPDVERPFPFSWKHCLDPLQINFVLAEICVWYLSLNEFIRPTALDDSCQTDIRQRAEQYAQPHDLLDYAAKYWAVHIRPGENTAVDALLEAVFRLCDTQSALFRTWFQLYWATVSTLWEFPKDMTPLMIASHFGLKPLVQRLLNSGADVNAQDSEGWAVLHWAVWEGHGVVWEGSEAVRQLLAAGADVGIEDKKGMSPLHWAAADGQEAIIRLLLEAGTAVDMRDSEGWTAMHFAAANGHDGAAELLLESGADINATDGDEEQKALPDAT
jgi:hypothetical protein